MKGICMKKVVCFLLLLVIIGSAVTQPVLAYSGWEPYGNEVVREAFWGQGATVADVCAAITSQFTPLSFTQLYYYLGVATIGSLAENTIGCTVRYQTYTAQPIGQPIHFMYEWSITDSNGTTYGPYLFTPNPYSASEVPGETNNPAIE